MITTMHSDQNASPPRVEVITSVQRRRRWPTAEKIRLVEETMQPGMSVSYVARRAGVAPSLLFNWRRRMLEGGLQAVQADEDVVGTSRVRELERRARELGAPARPQDHGSRDSQGSARRRAGKKTELATAIMERSEGRFAMKAVADTLAVARSNLIERVSRRAKSRRPYRKAGDDELLALIRRLVDERPTYGYRRIRRLINRQRKANGKPPVNGKRVLRIMQANKLTLERHTGRRPGRTHDGVVIALRSNIRWCSDHFELACRNGEIVRVLFAIDACDREVMGWLATSAGISGEMVRDLMIACRRASIRDQQGGASRRMVVRQRLGVHRQGHARHRNRLGPQALFHASPLATIQRHRGGIRQNLQTRLCSAVDLAGC